MNDDGVNDDDVNVDGLAGRLTAEREATRQRLEFLRVQLDRVIEATAGANTDDEHDPEGATIAFERAQLSSLLDQARRRLDELEGAQARLEAGRYGVCEHCGEAIAAARLSARPSATTCVRCAVPARRR